MARPSYIGYSSYNNYARGCCLLIHRTIPFQITETIQDPAGRYVITHGNILSCTLNLVSVYGPNEDNPKFFEELFLTLTTMRGFYLIGGDWNCCLSPELDRSTGSDTTKAQTRKLLKQYMVDMNLVEVWRELNPDKREYSCHSSVGKSRSRIDYFIVSRELLSKITDCWYDSIVISDHAAVSLTIHIDNLIHNPPNWRLSVMWLHNPDFVKFVGTKIDNYFELNTDQTSACIRWEAFKAYIRGEIISYTSTKSKQQKLEMETLEKQIKSLEVELNEGEDLAKQRVLLLLRAKFNKLSIDKATKGLMWLKQSFYDQGEKAGKLLAWRILKMQSDRAINSITTSPGVSTVNPFEINNCFKEFYEHLYKSECPKISEERDTFLDQLQFRTLNEDVKQGLDIDLTSEELLQAIQAINSGKAPGPDGLPIEFYKTFKEKLLSPLLNMYSESFQNGILPPSLRQAMMNSYFETRQTSWRMLFI